MRRLNPLDAQFLNRDSPDAPRQISTLAILAAGDRPLDYDRLIQVINERIDLVPRYRQIPKKLVGPLGLPVWVDDEHFDITLHVRRSALPKPGTRDSLNDLVGRLIARRLDHDRPLWELYLIEGLDSGEVVLLFKSHQALVDGSHTVDLAQVLLEETARDRDIPHEDWTPKSAPSAVQLLTSTVHENLTQPRKAVEAASYQFDRLTSWMPSITPEGQPPGPFNAELTRHRRFASLAVSLHDLRRVRDEHGGTVNDVILAVIAGGIRGWLLTRAERVTAKASVKAMVPMSVTAGQGDDPGAMPTSLGSRVRGQLLSLPVGEANAVVRLHQVSFALKGHRETGSAVAANKLAALPGFATTTFHAVGARVAEDQSNKGYSIVITNVPGPQDPVYMAGQQLQEVYPAIPLTGHRPVSIGVNSYNGKVFFGLVGDREAISDVEVLAQCISEALDELTDTLNQSQTRAPRGRQRPRKS